MNPSKADWEKFGELIPALKERYLGERIKEILSILDDSERSSTENYWNAEESIRREAKKLRECLDGFSKGNMDIQVLILYREGLLKKEDIKVFSQELQEWFTNAIKN